VHRAALSYSSTQTEPRLSDDEVVRTWAPLIDRCARRIAGRTANTITAGDLWSAGALGLLDAYKRFDNGRDVRFETFAEHRIRGAMIDELREMDHLPRRLRAETDRVRKARAALGQTLGREPTTEELAAHLNLPIEDVANLVTLAQPSVPVTPELPLHATEASQDEYVDKTTIVRRLTGAIEELPERLQLVLSLHYVEGLTYKEIALALEVSEARICQLHGEAVKKLRGQMLDLTDAA
jgi:RNA polymerase sigma factor for flagellar operon FliA